MIHMPFLNTPEENTKTNAKIREPESNSRFQLIAPSPILSKGLISGSGIQEKDFRLYLACRAVSSGLLGSCRAGNLDVRLVVVKSGIWSPSGDKLQQRMCVGGIGWGRGERMAIRGRAATRSQLELVEEYFPQVLLLATRFQITAQTFT